MPETTEDRRLDDQLAEFTDQVLSRESTGEPQMAPETEELRKLQEVVLRLKENGTQRTTSPSFAARLRAVLQEEWRHAGLASQNNQPAQPGFLKKFIQDATQEMHRYVEQSQPRTLALQFGAVLVVVLLVAAMILPPDSGGVLTGAAGTGAAIVPIIIVGGLLLVAIVIYLGRPKGK